MAEWLKAAVLKTASRFTGRGFKSYSLRHPSLKLRMAAIERRAPVAQMDRASDYESAGRPFESGRARQIKPMACNSTRGRFNEREGE